MLDVDDVNIVEDLVGACPQHLRLRVDGELMEFYFRSGTVRLYENNTQLVLASTSYVSPLNPTADGIMTSSEVRSVTVNLLNERRNRVRTCR